MKSDHKIAFVTGVSSGIGRAISLQLLKNGYHVFGIGRTNTISENRYQYIPLDLRKSDAISFFRFPQHLSDSYLLINNAGMIGEILPVGELNSENILDVMMVNAIAPQILTNTFIQTFLRQNADLHVVNISSGAGKRPVDAWSAYCASKAALDLFSETVRLEMDLREQKKFFIHAIAPGVVDTTMQSRIRETSSEKFKSSQQFRDLKINNELLHPDFVATKLMNLIASPETHKATLISLSDI